MRSSSLVPEAGAAVKMLPSVGEREVLVRSEHGGDDLLLPVPAPKDGDEPIQIVGIVRTV